MLPESLAIWRTGWLNANLYFALLTGHGQGGAAMGYASLADWDADVDEASAIGAALGNKPILMGCSTGCSLLTTALANRMRAKGCRSCVAQLRAAQPLGADAVELARFAPLGALGCGQGTAL